MPKYHGYRIILDVIPNIFPPSMLTTYRSLLTAHMIAPPGSIDHARLLAIMKDLGYPTNSINLVGNIYSQSSTIFTGEHFDKTLPIPIQRGTIQSDSLSPYLFIIFLEPLLRWLQQGNNGYTFDTSKVKITSAAYADDLATIANKLEIL